MADAILFIGVFLGALAADLALGEPPAWLHPVVWMGSAASWLEKPGFRLPSSLQIAYGTLLVVALAALFTAPTYYLLAYLQDLSWIAFLAVGILVFKTTFAVRELRRAALRIKQKLKDGNMGGARFELRALVKRDTKDLPEPLLVSAVVESVAENTCDSIIAPVFYFCIFGVPGAMAYRVINTLDAMIGHRGRYERLGKAAARLDSVANFIPARLTALMIVLAAWLLDLDGRRGWTTAWREHRRTASWNAGWPMAAAAGALGVQLEKVGHYRLGEEKATLGIDTIDKSLQLMSHVLWPCITMVILAGAIRYAITA